MAVDCDGTISLATRANWNCDGIQNEIYRFDSTGASKGTILMGIDVAALTATCRPGDLVGSLGKVFEASGTSIWRYTDGRFENAVTLPAQPAQPIALADNGDAWVNYSVGAARYFARVPSIVTPCGVTAQPFCAQLKSIAILTSTTRWKPQKDTTTPIAIAFTSPKPLQSAIVNITGPSAVAPLSVSSSSPVTDFVVQWTGPWLTDPANPASYLPAGDYTITVTGTTADGETLYSGSADPNAKVSLVEVKSVRLLRADGTAFKSPDDDDPAVPLTSAEKLAAEEPDATPRAARLGGGIRIFAEAAVPGGQVNDKVLVEITTTAAMPTDVPVYLTVKDVADPDGAERLPGPMTVGDNMELAPAPTSPVMVAKNTSAVRAEFQVSHQPVDNFRVVASTSPAWLAGVRAYRPSAIGEVRAC
jgi:hypothetical protein